MKPPIEYRLDDCLGQLQMGVALDEVLSAHADVAHVLKPMLVAALRTRLCPPPPSRNAMQLAKHHLLMLARERRREVEAIDHSIARLKAGVPLERLVADAPADIRQALRAAEWMRTTPVPGPSHEALRRGRVHLLTAVRQRRALTHPRADWQGELSALWNSLLRPAARRPLWRASLASLTLSVALLGGVVGVTGSARALPGEPLYPVLRLREDVRLSMTRDESARLQLLTQYAERRVAELSALRAAGRRIPEGLRLEVARFVLLAHQMCLASDDAVCAATFQELLDQAQREIRRTMGAQADRGEVNAAVLQLQAMRGQPESPAAAEASLGSSAQMDMPIRPAPKHQRPGERQEARDLEDSRAGPAPAGQPAAPSAPSAPEPERVGAASDFIGGDSGQPDSGGSPGSGNASPDSGGPAPAPSPTPVIVGGETGGDDRFPTDTPTPVPSDTPQATQTPSPETSPTPES